MNLGARIIGVSIYVALLLAFCFLIRRTSKKSVKKVLLLYAVILSVIGFFFVPDKGNDLYRAFDSMQYYSSIPFDQFFNNMVLKSTTPLSLLLYWTVGQLNNPGLLPFIASLVFYFNIFYIFYDYSKKENISNKAMSIGLLVIMCNSSFFEVISGIRNMLAFSIVLRCIYNEFYNEKPIYKNIIWYLIAILIHPAALAVVFLRLFYAVFQKSKTVLRKVIVVISSICLISFLWFFANDFIMGAIAKGVDYVENDGYSYLWETAISLLILLALVFIKYRCGSFSSTSQNNKIALQNTRNVSRLIEGIMMIFIFEHSIFFRFGNFNLFFNIPILLTYFNSLIKQKNNNYKLAVLYFVLILVITCVRGNLCSLKFWEGF